jgi:hypothetical protein
MQSYIDNGNFDGLSNIKARNMREYGNPLGPTADQLFDKYDVTVKYEGDYPRASRQ